MSGVYHQSFEALVEDLKKYKSEKVKVALVCASRTRAKRLAESFQNEYALNAFFEEDKRDVDIEPGQIAIFVGKSLFLRRINGLSY